MNGEFEPVTLVEVSPLSSTTIQPALLQHGNDAAAAADDDQLPPHKCCACNIIIYHLTIIY